MLVNLVVYVGISGFLLDLVFTDEGTSPLKFGAPALLIVVFCFFPESPGKRCYRLKLIDENRNKIGSKKRLYRSVFLLPFFLACTAFHYVSIPQVKVVFGVVSWGALALFLANGLSARFTRDLRTYLDRKLNIYTVRNRRLLEEITHPLSSEAEKT